VFFVSGWATISILDRLVLRDLLDTGQDLRTGSPRIVPPDRACHSV